MIISASLMCADLTRLGEAVAELEAAGVDWLHFDIMDGQFVPNLTFGPDIIAALRPLTKLPLDVHLMVEEPARYAGRFREAGADVLVLSAEACTHLQRSLQQVRDLGARCGAALSPATPLSALEYVLDDVDLILLMTVNPGYAGQKLVPATIGKIARLRQMLAAEGRDIAIQVDGNVSFESAPLMAEAGATIFVAGSSSVFAPGMTLAEATARLRTALGGPVPGQTSRQP